KGDVSSYRPGMRKLTADMQQNFGEPITARCLNEYPITVARLVRNTLTHNGGMITEELKNLNPGLSVVDGIVQITAANTRQLFTDLSVRALDFLEIAVNKSN